MLLYMVGIDRSTFNATPHLVGQTIPQLHSFFYLKKSKGYVPADVLRNRFPCSSLFIDSGAFSAYNMKVALNLGDYIVYLQENAQYIDAYACLDVIGDAEATYKNFLEMRREGLEPLPVFHCRSDVKWLRKFIEDEGCNYVAIGGVAGNPALRNAFFTRVMPIMSDADGNSRVKFHGFGMTDVRYMRMFPWYSVDSASWALVAGFGNVFYLLDDGRYGILGVSSESPSRKMAKRKHIERLPKVEQAMFIQLFTKHGFTLEQLQSGAKFRRPWNIVMCQKIADLITGEDVKHKVSQEFFV